MKTRLMIGIATLSAIALIFSFFPDITYAGEDERGPDGRGEGRPERGMRPGGGFDELIKEFLEEYDLDGDGSLGADEIELIKAIAADKPERGEGEAANEDYRKATRFLMMMPRFDLNADGAVGKEEIESVRKEMKQMREGGRDGDTPDRPGDSPGRDGQPRRPAAMLTPEEMARVIAKFDADGDGKLNEEERRKADAFIKELVEEKMKEGLKRRFDRDGDGELNEEEQAAYEEALKKMADEKTKRARLKASLKKAFDINGNGEIDRDEIMLIVEVIKEIVPPEALVRLLGGNRPDAPRGGDRPAGVDRPRDGDRSRDGDRPGGEDRPSKEELIKQFDKNSDGILDDEERAALIEHLKKTRGDRGRDGDRPERGRGGRGAPDRERPGHDDDREGDHGESDRDEDGHHGDDDDDDDDGEDF